MERDTKELWAIMSVLGIALIALYLMMIAPAMKSADQSLKNIDQIQKNIDQIIKNIDQPTNNKIKTPDNLYGVYLDECQGNIKYYGIDFTKDTKEIIKINKSEPITINVCGNTLRLINWSYIPKHDFCYDENKTRCFIKYQEGAK